MKLFYIEHALVWVETVQFASWLDANNYAISTYGPLARAVAV